MKKKHLVFFLLLILLAVGYGFFFWQNQKRIAQDIYLENEQTFYQNLKKQQAQAEIATDEQRQTLEQTEFIYYLPKTDDQHVLEVLKPLLEKEFSSLVGDTKKGPEKVVLKPTKNEIMPNVMQYVYQITRYQWQKEEHVWTESEHKKSAPFLVNQTNQQLLTLGDVAGSKSHLLSIQRKVTENLLAESKNPKKAVDQILNLPSLTMNSTDFYYDENELIIFYPKNDLQLKKTSLALSAIGAFLNPTFAHEKNLKSLPEKPLDESKKYIALTFDDGPSDKTTEDLLAILKEQQVVATFFLLGQQVNKFPDIVQQIAENGHELGNHSYSHKNFVDSDAALVREEVNQTQSAIYKATGVLPVLMRPPYGSINREKAAIVGMPLAMWSVDSQDWSFKNAQKTLNEVKCTVKNNSIVLMHDIHEETVKAFPKLIQELRKDGYEFVTVSELLTTTPEPMYTYYSANDFREVVN